MIDLDNAELQNALQIIQFTRRSLFLTGKAGTGKSTFLRYIAANTKKNISSWHLLASQPSMPVEAPCTVSSSYLSTHCCPTTVCIRCAISETH